MKKIFSLLSLIACMSVVAIAQPQITVTTFSTGYARVTDIRNCKDSRLFMVQQAGKIFICDTNGVKRTTPFLDISSKVTQPSGGDERGLLGLTFHPNYKQNGYFYVDYTAISGGATKIARYSVSAADSNVADPTSELILLSIRQPYTNHNGGCLNFGQDGYLYIGTGDGGSGGDPQNRAQNLDSLLGKMLRIDVNNPAPGLNYGIPADNPFVNAAGRDEIWAYGIRNPWKWSFDRIYGDMWLGDVGQNAVEEIDFQQAGIVGGQNYGWRCYEAGVNYNVGASCPAMNATILPVATFTHAATGACSVTGGYIYRGAKYANLYGYYFYTDYCDRIIRATKQEANGTFTSYSLGTFAASADYVAFGEDYRGEIYISELTSGKIVKIASPVCLPTASIIGLADTVAICSGSSTPVLHAVYHPENTYEWLKDGVTVSFGAIGATCTAFVDGNYQVVVTNPTLCSDTSAVVTVITVIPPVVTLTGVDTAYCTIDPIVTLTGMPAGGVYNGTAGVIGNTFDPAAGPGIYDIWYTFTDSYGCTAQSTSVTEVTICTGINNYDALAVNQLYPNPNEGIFTLELMSNQALNGLMTMVNIAGKTVKQNNVNMTRGTNKMMINASDLPSGIYFVKITTAQGEINQRVIVK